MNLDQELVFAYLEEDTVQRAYFRVRPLITCHGDIREEAVRLWPDEGCLRIVPDRAEQHTFKDRMRALGHYCAVDLRGIPTDAGKIRTNKNYRPDRGEVNQFILYSDTVKPLPEHTFFEVLSGTAEDVAALAEKAVTPLFYIRVEDTLLGPVQKRHPMPPQPAAEAAGTLVPVESPDGLQRLMLCMSSPEPTAAPAPAPKAAVPVPKPAAPAAPDPAPRAAAPAASAPASQSTPAAEDAPLPLGQKLNILDEGKSFDETLQRLDQPLSKGANLLHTPEAPQNRPAPAPSAPLSGTPLFRAPLKTSVPQPKNKLQEVVSSQWRVARYEPPADSLPAGTTMRHVVNPVETACQSLRAAWEVPEAQTQLTDFILSLDGMRAKLEPKLSPSGGDTPLQRVMWANINISLRKSVFQATLLTLQPPTPATVVCCSLAPRAPAPAASSPLPTRWLALIAASTALSSPWMQATLRLIAPSVRRGSTCCWAAGCQSAVRLTASIIRCIAIAARLRLMAAT